MKRAVSLADGGAGQTSGEDWKLGLSRDKIEEMSQGIGQEANGAFYKKQRRSAVVDSERCRWQSHRTGHPPDTEGGAVMRWRLQDQGDGVGLNLSRLAASVTTLLRQKTPRSE